MDSRGMVCRKHSSGRFHFEEAGFGQVDASSTALGAAKAYFVWLRRYAPVSWRS